MTHRTATRSPPAVLLPTLLAAALLGACDRAGPSAGPVSEPDDTDRDAPATLVEPPGATATDGVEPGIPAAAASADDGDAFAMTVYKSPTCGCCAAWVDYMREEGFAVETVDTDALDAVKARHGLSDPGLASCHTAVVGDYVVEGHVPADDVRRLLAERPDVVGLTAPGMPMMSPGMGSREPSGYDVLAVEPDGGTRVWSSY